MKKNVLRIRAIGLLIALSSNVFSSSLSEPATIIPVARVALGGSYELGGYTITNDSVPCLLNRFQGFVTFAPFSFLNVGIDAGVSQMDVSDDTTARDTIGVFHGDYGFSGGVHVRLGTPFYYNGLFRCIGIGKATIFSSKNKDGAAYGGKDGSGAVGLQFHVPRFGFITVGPQVYLMEGENKSYFGAKHRYSNLNNVRGWLAIDFFPPDKLKSSNKFFISLEVSLSPKAGFGDRVPVREMSFSINFGSITKRLYGQESDVEWSP
jgi:hypothetical protein